MADGVFPSVSAPGHSSEQVFFSAAAKFGLSASSILSETLSYSGFEISCTELLNVF